MPTGGRRPLVQLVGMLAIALASLVAVVAGENALVGTAFPHLARFTTDFSPAYLQREVRALATVPAPTIFLGDSVVWGYRLQPEQTAVALLASRGCTCRNFGFKAGSPPNYYALVKLLRSAGVRPRAVVVEVNQRVFNDVDDSYRKLHPALAAEAGTLLAPDERAALTLPPPERGIRAALDANVSSWWLLYAMRADIRETLYGEAGTAPEPAPTADAFLGTYDLTPLGERNVGVRFLEKTADFLRSGDVALIAFMTPTNHPLLHEYIDGPEYRANGDYLKRLLAARGARVLDLDRAFPAAEFLDNDHLTAAGQQRLAARLAEALRDAGRYAPLSRRATLRAVSATSKAATFAAAAPATPEHPRRRGRKMTVVGPVQRSVVGTPFVCREVVERSVERYPGCFEVVGHDALPFDPRGDVERSGRAGRPVCPAMAGDLPAERSVILARVRGDAVVVWDATDELLAMLTKKKSKAEILRSLEVEAARLLVDRARKIKHRATTLTVNVTYERIGAISAAYKTATIEGYEQLLRLKAPVGAATGANTWPADITSGKVPKDLEVTVVGALPPEVR